ncbi:MAG TPA: hypothetical protein VMY06_03900 [Sedimentisphaerales bacterium]|nr:hypothetical protein [Sedimentisphaerales bacterium]
MNEKASNNHSNSKDCQPAREYSRAQQFVNNLPYAAMAVLGAAIFVTGFENPVWGWAAAGAYLIYSVAGAFWIMIFVCPFCERYDTMCCPCGYGRIATRLRQIKDTSRFKEKFRKHILVIVPLWFIPVLVGAVFAVRSFSWSLLVLLILFALDAFVVLPLFSTKHGCADCPQKDSCPWMRHKD